MSGEEGQRLQLTFSYKKGQDAVTSETASSLFRVVQQLLEASALHSVEFDTEEHEAYRASIREIAHRFEEAHDHHDFLILTGETTKTIQSYNKLVERFIREFSMEKQRAVELLSHSLLRVCHASENTAQNLRQIEQELATASQLKDMREVRAKLTECVGILCREAEVQEAQFMELKERIAESATPIRLRDQVTGLNGMKSAESRIKEVSGMGHQGYAIGFFLRNLDVVNRRFGFAAGDGVLKKFASYLEASLQTGDQLFRWRGPCFVVVADRLATLEEVQGNAHKVCVRGPEIEVESGDNSMLLRLTAATLVLPIGRNQGHSNGEISARIDQFAAEQFKLTPAR